MLYLVTFLLGIIFTIMLFNGKINIRIHHIHEMVSHDKDITDDDLKAAAKTMDVPDTELDQLYEKLGEAKDLFEGSDRIDG